MMIRALKYGYPILYDVSLSHTHTLSLSLSLSLSLTHTHTHTHTQVRALDDDEGDEVWVSYSGYDLPSTLSMSSVQEGGGGIVERATLLKSLPAMFDAEGLTVMQREATSADGTMIPYFLVVKGDVPTDGKCKTQLYGYGGFEVSLQPGYSGEVGVGWLEQV